VLASLQTLDLALIVNSPLNPLRFCHATTVRQFAESASHLQVHTFLFALSSKNFFHSICCFFYFRLSFAIPSWYATNDSDLKKAVPMLWHWILNTPLRSTYCLDQTSTWILCWLTNRSGVSIRCTTATKWWRNFYQNHPGSVGSCTTSSADGLLPFWSVISSPFSLLMLFRLLLA